MSKNQEIQDCIETVKNVANIVAEQKQNYINSLKEKRDKIKTKLNKPDALQQSFYGGHVGFKTGIARKKWEKSIDKELDLMRELSAIEEIIERLENPVIRKKTIEIPTTTFSIGDKCFDLYHNKLTVIKINKKTVSVVNRFGDIENIKPHLLSR